MAEAVTGACANSGLCIKPLLLSSLILSELLPKGPSSKYEFED
jgi:hypothetical protein